MKMFIPLLLLLLLEPCLRAEEVVFQNGMNGYTGAADGNLVGSSQKTMTTSYWDRETLKISGTARGGHRSLALIRFDNLFGPGAQQIPPGAKVTQARLELHKTGEPKDRGQYAATPAGARHIACHQMLTSYTPGRPDRDSDAFACFSYRSYHRGEGEYWGEHYRLEEGPVKGVDYEKKPLGVIPLEVGVIGEPAVVDVTEAVSRWAQGEDNHGFFLTARGYWIGAFFASSQHAEPAWRPRLMVEYQR